MNKQHIINKKINNIQNINNIIVISLGGSLIVPDSGRIDIDFLSKFKDVINHFIKKGMRFVIICGGGKTARLYQDAASKLHKLRPEDIDWIGIHATRLNAQLIKSLFLDNVHEIVIHNPSEKIEWNEAVLIAAGWKPGFSTDYDAVMLANTFGVKIVINLTNIDYVYNKPPKDNHDAIPLKEISWSEFRKINGKKWEPGLNTPFDPIASSEAEKSKITVVVMKGVENLKRFLNNQDFVGTIIH